MAIFFDNLDIDNANAGYIVTSLNEERSTPSRALKTTPIARREGSKFLGEDYEAKTITITGIIFADDAAIFLSRVDTFKQTMAGRQKSLQIRDGRFYTATAIRIDIRDNIGATTHVEYSAEFIVTDPFEKGSQRLLSLPVTSGTLTYSGMVTISGTAPSRPLIGYTVGTAGTGDTPIGRIDILHRNTGETITWSGSSSDLFLDYGALISFDYNSNVVTIDSTQQKFEGLFSTWSPGVNNFVVTFSGANVGGTVTFDYRPRYL